MLPLTMRLLFAITAAVILAGSDASAEPQKFNDWQLITVGKSDSKNCYVATEVKEAGSGPAERSVSAVYISAWPKDGIKAEVSVKLGFAPKADVGAKATVGKDSFAMFIKDEHAFVADATQELKLVDAMKKGQKLVIEASTAAGVSVKDTYSLSGITGALAAKTAACP
jgi:invasion protein IalB